VAHAVRAPQVLDLGFNYAEVLTKNLQIICNPENQMLARFKFVVLLILFLSVASPAFAQSGEGGGNVQTPVQVIVQIVGTAAILKLLNKFDLP
jgi:hypothetical protein